MCPAVSTYFRSLPQTHAKRNENTLRLIGSVLERWWPACSSCTTTALWSRRSWSFLRVGYVRLQRRSTLRCDAVYFGTVLTFRRIVFLRNVGIIIVGCRQGPLKPQLAGSILLATTLEMSKGVLYLRLVMPRQKAETVLIN